MSGVLVTFVVPSLHLARDGTCVLEQAHEVSGVHLTHICRVHGRNVLVWATRHAKSLAFYQSVLVYSTTQILYVILYWFGPMAEDKRFGNRWSSWSGQRSETHKRFKREIMDCTITKAKQKLVQTKSRLFAPITVGIVLSWKSDDASNPNSYWHSFEFFALLYLGSSNSIVLISSSPFFIQ